MPLNKGENISRKKINDLVKVAKKQLKVSFSQLSFHYNRMNIFSVIVKLYYRY